MELVQYMIAAIALAAGCKKDVQEKKVGKRLLAVFLGVVLAVRCMEAMDLFMQNKENTGLAALLGALAVKTAAGMIPGICCLLLSFFTGQALGYGDSLLILICGMGIGMKAMVRVLVISFAGAGMVSVLLLISGRADRKKELPFIPFLLAGVILCIK